MMIRNALALGLAVFAMSGTAFANDASADRAAAETASREATSAERAKSDDHNCGMDCCAKNTPAPRSTPQFTDAG